MPDYYHPAGSIAVRSKLSPAVVYVSPSRTSAIGYRGGRAVNPAFNYCYRNREQMERHIAEFFADQARAVSSRAKRQQERREKLAKPHSLEVGDVLYSMWGYEQTNVDYYQVTAVIGKRTVEIRQIGSQSEDTAYMQGVSVPAVGYFVGDPMRKRVNEYGRVAITSFSSAGKLPYQEVAGIRAYEPKSWTAYA